MVQRERDAGPRGKGGGKEAAREERRKKKKKKRKNSQKKNNPPAKSEIGKSSLINTPSKGGVKSLENQRKLDPGIFL